MGAGRAGQLSTKCWAQRSAGRPSSPWAGTNSSGTASGPFFFRSRSKICNEQTDRQTLRHPEGPVPRPTPLSPPRPHLEGSELQQRRDADLGHRQCLVDDAGSLRHLGVVMLLEGLAGARGCHHPRGQSLTSRQPSREAGGDSRHRPGPPQVPGGLGLQTLALLGGAGAGSSGSPRWRGTRHAGLTCSSQRELSRARLLAGSSSPGS